MNSAEQRKCIHGKKPKAWFGRFFNRLSSRCSRTISARFWTPHRDRKRQSKEKPRGSDKKTLPDGHYFNSFPTKGTHQTAIRRGNKCQPDRERRKTALDDSGEDRERERCAGICGRPARAILRRTGKRSDRG